MKAMILVLSPKESCDLLNGDLSVLVRKKFPSDYVGWVYIYCTKDKSLVKVGGRYLHIKNNFAKKFSEYQNMSGKVVARFWCDKVEEIKWHKDTAVDLDYYKVVNVIENKEILKASCLQLKELEDYLQIKNAKNIPTTWGITFNLGKAIHITDPKPFDKPKEISEFKAYCGRRFNWYCDKCLNCKAYTVDYDIEDYCKKSKLTLTRAPQSWQFIEV